MKPNHSIVILCILYFVGVIGISMPIHEQFVLLTPLNLLISFGIILWHHPDKDLKLLWLVLICFWGGLLIEILGVQTGVIFGEYQYGKVLGWKIWGTPLMIGVNWAMLVYASCCTVNLFIEKQHWLLKSILAAFSMMLLDILIEPIAIKLEFWTWAKDDVPLQNYIAWFLIALPLTASFYHLLGNVKNKVAVALFILQFLFFGSLSLLL